MDAVFTNNAAQNRFEYAVQGAVAVAEYRLEGEKIYINKVETPEALRGQGIAGKVMQHVYDYTQANGLTIVPVCSYAVNWMEKNAPAGKPASPGTPGSFTPPKIKF